MAGWMKALAVALAAVMMSIPVLGQIAANEVKALATQILPTGEELTDVQLEEIYGTLRVDWEDWLFGLYLGFVLAYATYMSGAPWGAAVLVGVVSAVTWIAGRMLR